MKVKNVQNKSLKKSEKCEVKADNRYILSEKRSNEKKCYICEFQCLKDKSRLKTQNYMDT